MNMESQVSCREASDVPETVFIKDVITSETHHVAPNPPETNTTMGCLDASGRRKFFNALRQVGKNFEKITSRVQSKNKDQVRHYYYRLVRRMNKLLGPELSLDAKNSKDTNAAMLRCCKASKLHLKPRRFKHFLESLGGSSTAAYRKWEKAAIAGVSLVADAAAHLEQTALDKLVDGVQFMRDNHNPHLELTLSCRKKISSVLEHINRKWGSCSIASGELMLLPYHAPSLNPVICQKWTQDSVLSAADVYAAIGSPPVFRLRYGWFTTPNQEPQPVSAAQRFNMNSVEEKGSQKNAGAVSVFEWADSLTNTSISDLLSDKLPDAEEPVQDCHAEVDAMDECPSDVNPKDDSAKDLHALTDIYWPDSLGPLEVDVPPCRYQSNDLILSESLGGLTRILTSSLDAFFFGVEQRVGDRESTPVNIVP
ncbi:putative transcription factor MYB-HB-like family [Helianthus annuus]|nr:putative transcription factor MYB-HB-like family [Helianthus annuus]